MAVRAPQSESIRPRPAATVIDAILGRDEVRQDDAEWREGAKEHDKAGRKPAKVLRKQQHEREKDLRKAARQQKRGHSNG